MLEEKASQTEIKEVWVRVGVRVRVRVRGEGLANGEQKGAALGLGLAVRRGARVARDSAVAPALPRLLPLGL